MAHGHNRTAGTVSYGPPVSFEVAPSDTTPAGRLAIHVRRTLAAAAALIAFDKNLTVDHVVRIRCDD
ncbi:hypothetical protein [Yinghuangia sp. YIM S10712]|uniref:hypothetical protein n=1 Tax=Yinghuangia sp. YIM S10712 TaxID=3436930 RepID=UPI003F5383B6